MKNMMPTMLNTVIVEKRTGYLRGFGLGVVITGSGVVDSEVVGFGVVRIISVEF